MQKPSVDLMQGVEDAGAEKISRPLMTEQERRILELYDRLEELQLEIAFLKAQGVLSYGEAKEVTEEDIKIAQQELLEATAQYQVRNNIVESVLVANPILKAVHAGDNATVIEQDLLPIVQQRDNSSATLSELSSKTLLMQSELTKVESERIVVARQNLELASAMLSLTDEMKAQRKEDIHDEKVRRQLEELEEAVKISRQRWRIMKGTASATIVGSGIDWARNPKLLEIVLDGDGEE
ncbi:centromere protein H (CENP-H)-domain-containing protein [Bisporella sp. PMI_857]|nr:centromere protein H (CENP-H)-domain-containing protein [Bisporella sp. PMI_857]